MKDCIDDICGEVEDVKYLKTGGLLITTKTLEQAKILLSCTHLTANNITINSKIAWQSQFSYGRILALEFLNMSLETILNKLQKNNIVAVRKMYADPKRQNSPLYVLTFLGELPTRIIAGYSSYVVDKYYNSPHRCGKCYRYGHSKTTCRSAAICSICTSKEHGYKECTSTNPKCSNCKGSHPATSKDCPHYQMEKQACTLQADLGIAFPEARELARSQRNNQEFTQSNINDCHMNYNANYFSPQIASQKEFPSLPNLAQQTKQNLIVQQPSTSKGTASNGSYPTYSQTTLDLLA